MPSSQRLQKALITSLVLSLIVVVVLSLFSDMRQVWHDISTFRWIELPAILGFTLLNYLLRWLKWDYYLRYLELGHGVSRGDSGLIFTAGMVMSVTPGKIGEVFKSFLLRRVNHTPVSVSAPVVVVERLTDGLGMLLLMGLGLTMYPPARPLFALLLGMSVIGIALVHYRPLCERMIAQIAGLPAGTRIAPKLTTLYESTYQLLGWRVMLFSVLLSVLSWGMECIAFFFVLTGLGVEPSPLLLLQATFIFAASTLLGLVSFLPGGLGMSEVSSAGLLVAIVGVSLSVATTATIIIRFCTLWFGVLLGVVALIWFRQRYRGDPALDSASVEAS
ncbi:MAG: flippase-like domain-containing protein [Chloroflexaceae bacterium]|nr:flippase-like domain-containing protein [Chloroflexaceae bacterium]